MSGGRKPERIDYDFGPFSITLPDGWQAELEDGVHTIAAQDHDKALQISGFERDAPVEMSDLYGMVPEGMSDLSRFTLPSGLDGFAWLDPEDDARRMVVRSGKFVLALSEVPGEQPDDDATEQMEDIISTLALKEQPA